MTAFWSATINGAILSALLTIVVWVALRITPRRALNAATRYAIWWIVLLATLALPLSYAQWPRRTAVALYAQVMPLTDPAPALPIAVPAAAPRIVLPLEIPASPWLQPILIAWIAAALLLLLRVALSYATLYRRTARAIDAPRELRARLGANSRQLRVALSEEIDIPMAVGPFRPAILIPARLFATMTQSDLDQIVIHEATHLARRDDYTLFLQRIVEALFALHPVVRWITRQLDLEREIACDDAVARSTDTARSYADCLTRMVQACGGVRPSLAAAAFADSRSHLSRRVELLMRADRTGSTRLLHRPFALIAVGLLCAVVLLAKTPLMVAFATPQSTTPLYVVGPGDIISVTVTADEKRVSGNYEVAPDGDISLPTIGVENAAGLTLLALRSLIKRRLGADINDPVVDVQLLRPNGKKYILSGAVLKPGPYPLLKETTILDALKASGGFNAMAATNKIILLRGQKVSGIREAVTFSESIPFNYNQVIRGIHTEQNVTIQDGDVLLVPGYRHGRIQ